MQYVLIIVVQYFCPLKIKITQFHGGFRLNVFISDKDTGKLYVQFLRPK